MSNTPKVAKGGWRCGAVRFVATGAPSKVSYCHCPSWGKATGAPVSAAVVYEAPEVRFSRGAPRIYESCSGVQRGFCERCGTSLSWAGLWHEPRSVFFYVGAFDDPAAMRPDRHAFCEHRLEWFDTADELPRCRAR